MVVYLDLVILTNILVDYAFLKTIALLYHERLKWYRVLISLLIGTGSLFLFLIPIKYLYNIRYIIGILMGLTAYNSNKAKKRFLMIISFYLINLSFIGSLVIFEIKNSLFLLVALIYIILLHIIEKILKINYQNDCIVKINQNTLIGLIDTGNNCFYNDIPIVFLQKKYYSDDFVYFGNIQISTINNQNILEVYQGPILMTNKKEFKVLYCFSEIQDYDIILNKIMEE